MFITIINNYIKEQRTMKNLLTHPFAQFIYVAIGFYSVLLLGCDSRFNHFGAGVFFSSLYWLCIWFYYYSKEAYKND